MIFNIYKYRGETPLEAVQRFRLERPEFKEEKSLDSTRDKWTYMGRLDPMAEGVLLVANGDDVLRKEEFTDLDKEYEFVALFGFSTDTYDTLGKILRVEKVGLPETLSHMRGGRGELDEGKIIKMLAVYKGEREQKYPPFSSRTVGGKAMHEWAREGRIGEIEVPTKKINIFDVSLQKVSRLSPKELFGRLLMDISKVKGDFRQNQTLILWKEVLANYGDNCVIANFKAHVSSGTYIRSIVNDLGNSLGVGACALSINRTRVGDYKLEDSIK